MAAIAQPICTAAGGTLCTYTPVRCVPLARVRLFVCRDSLCPRRGGSFGQFYHAKTSVRRVLASESAARAHGQRGPWSGSRADSCEHARVLAPRRASDEVGMADRRRYLGLSPASACGPRFSASWRQLTRHACNQNLAFGVVGYIMYVYLSDIYQIRSDNCKRNLESNSPHCSSGCRRMRALGRAGEFGRERALRITAAASSSLLL